MKSWMSSASAVLLVACGSGGSSIPDSRIGASDSAIAIDSVRTDDAAGIPVTVQLYPIAPGASFANVPVRFETPGGTAIETTTDSNGLVSEVVPAGTSITAGESIASDTAVTILLSLLDVQPGDNYVIGAPAVPTSAVSFTVDLTPPDDTSQIFVQTPCGNTSVAAGGTSASIQGSCATSPMEIVAYTTDGNNNVAKWVSLTNQTPANSQTYTLPSTWTTASTVTGTVSNAPDIFTNSAFELYEESQSTVFFDTKSSGFSLSTGGATLSMSYVPTQDENLKLALASTDNQTKYDLYLSQVPTTVTADLSANSLPTLSNIAIDEISRAVTWTESAATGTPAILAGRLAEMQYTRGTGNAVTTVEWLVIAPPNASPGLALPQPPTALAADDVSGVSVLGAYEMSFAQTVSFPDFVHYASLSIGGASDSPSGIFIDSGDWIGM